MISIKVYGSRAAVKLKKEIAAASSFYLRELMPRKRSIQIKIYLVKNLIKDETVHGDCCQDECNNYTIRLNYDECSGVILCTLAHEFVHLKQFDHNELKFYSANHGKVRWKGMIYDNYNYDECPWEIEANSQEIHLYTAYLDSLIVT